MSVKGYLGPEAAHLIGTNRVRGDDGKIIADSAGNPEEIVRKDSAGDQVSGPVTMDEFGEIFGAIIDADNNIIVDDRLSMANVLVVKQNPGDGEYSSVAAALADVVSPSLTNHWVIEIGPGIYTEPQLVLQTGVHLKGFETASAILQPSVTTTAFIVGASGASISRLTVRGANGVGGIGVSYSNGAAPRFDITDASLTDCTTLVSVTSTAPGTPCVTTVRNCTFNGPFTTGLLVTTAGGATNTLVNGLLYFNPLGVAATSVLKATGTGGTLLVTDSFTIQVGGNGVHVADGARLFCKSFAAASCARAIWVENTGAAPAANIAGFVGRLNTADLVVDHPTATGSAMGSFVVANCTVASSTFSFFSADPTDGITLTGDVNFGPTFAAKTPYTQLLIQAPTMGLLNGGTLTNGGGTTVNVAAGYGYYEAGGAVVYKSWSATSITLGAAVDEYIYFDNSGNLTSNATLPDTTANIVLGRAITRSGTLFVINPIAQLARHTSNKLATTMRQGLGPVVGGGMIVSENATPLHLNITSGTYFIGVSNYAPAASTDFAFTSLYRISSGADWAVQATTNTIDVTNYDNNTGAVIPMTNNRWGKHVIYAYGDATVGQSYFMVYSQGQYTSQAAAEAAALPTPPPFFREAIIPVAAIVFQKGASSITQVGGAGSILDVRPRIGTTSTGTAISDHNSLSNLAVGDVHTQYLPVDGSRPMTGALPLTEQAAPSTPSSGFGKIYDATDGKLHFLNDDGVDFLVGNAPTIQGFNLVTSPNSAAGWTVTTAGTPMTVATTTTAGDLPLGGIANSAIKITSRTSAGTEAAEYVSYSFTTPASVSGKLGIYIFQRPGTNFIASEWSISVYQGTTRQTLSTDSGGVTYLPNLAGPFVTTVDVVASTTYTLRFARPVNAGGNAGVLNIAGVMVGAPPRAQGAVVGPWVTAVTPGSGWFVTGPTNVTTTVKERRVGTSIEVLYHILATGTSAAFSELEVRLPGTYTYDTSVITQAATTRVPLGRLDLLKAGVNSATGIAFAVTATNSFVVRYESDTVLAPAAITNTTPVDWNTTTNATSIQILITVPIAEWAGSGTVNLGQNDVEYASVGGTWDADTSTTVYGPAGSAMGGTLTGSHAKTITWQTPVQATDRIQVWASEDQVNWYEIEGARVGGSTHIARSYSSTGSALSGVFWRKGASNFETVVIFAQYANAANDDAPVTNWPSTSAYWVVTKAKTGQAVGFGLADTAGNAGLVNPYSPSSGSVVYAGTYTPTLFNTTNVAASTAYVCQYMRVGPVVTVSGAVDIDPSAATTVTSLGISLPIASNLSTVSQLGGTSCGDAASGTFVAGKVRPDTTNDRAVLDFFATADVVNRGHYFTFTYLIV